MQVLYGMDYVAAAREAQHEHMRSALLAHVRLHPQSLLVVEEYDKLDCATRGLFRQLIENPASANISLERRAQPGACPCMRLFAPRVCGPLHAADASFQSVQQARDRRLPICQ